MTANATQRAVRNIVRSISPPKKLNILTFCAHERYEQQLCKTGHDFYSLAVGKTWDTDYGKIPDNYHVISNIPDYLDFDLILSHTSDERLQNIHDYLSKTQGSNKNLTTIPILRHCHVLPDIRFDVANQVESFQNILGDYNSFISEFNMRAWGYKASPTTSVIEHGVDVGFWQDYKNIDRDNVCLSVVNDWPNRDWCCGFELWRQTTQGLPTAVYGKAPGFSEPANSIEHLRQIYHNSRIFYNTSLHSPVPTVLLEAMACGCAIVSTATCMIPEIIEHGENGLISNKPEELRAYLDLLLNNEELAIKMGQNAKNTITQRFSLNKFIDSWNELFRNIIVNYRG